MSSRSSCCVIGAACLGILLPCLQPPAVAWQATGKGSIVGITTGPDGTPMGGVTVTALIVPVKLASLRAPVISAGVGGDAVSKASGVFSIMNVPPGNYYVCAKLEGTQFLDPCQWSTQVNTVTVTAGGNADVGHIPLLQGTIFRININYLPALLSSSAVVEGLQHLMVGVWSTTRRLFYPAALTTQTASGRIHEVVIPYNTTFHLGLNTSTLQFQDAAGKLFSALGMPVTVFVPTSTGSQSVTVNLIGLNSSQ